MKVVAFIFLFPLSSWAGTVSINGKTYNCSGSMSVVNGHATCNGKPMDGEASGGPCGASKVRTHANGGGQVDVLATVSPDASIKGVVCGNARIAKSVVVQRGATINGAIEISEGASIGADSTINGGGKIGRNVIIGKGVTLNGDIQIANTQIADGTTLNGDITTDGVTLTGSLTCSGEGAIRANPPVGTAQ